MLRIALYMTLVLIGQMEKITLSIFEHYTVLNTHACRAKGMDLALAVGLLHAAAFALGYFLSRGLKFDEKTARTVSIETGGAR